MLPVGFEPTISAGERPQTYVLDRAATVAGIWICTYIKPALKLSKCAKLENAGECTQHASILYRHVR